jgi:hypothetical protein
MALEFWTDYQSRKELIDKYNENSLVLYTLELYADVEDIDSIAVNSLTDNADDKKCDLLYIEKDSGIVIIAQGYFSSDMSKKEAKSNKASDLNTAVTWLLKQDYNDLPETLKSAGKELVDSINNNEINSIEFWYVHNLPESANVENELKKVAETAHALIKKNFPKTNIERISYKEYGINNIEELYRSTKVSIKIDSDFEIDIDDGFELQSDKYKIFTTATNGAWLKDMYNKYKNDLFSTNIRDYLGSRNSQENINNKIKETASNNENDFFAYNNGITIIVNKLDIENYQEKRKIKFCGLAVVNGAQTTGAIASSKSKDFSKIKVLTRFVQYVDKSIIDNIIRFNNTQNSIEISDFRSNDDVQKRLRNEFKLIPAFDYTGARRGLQGDATRRPQALIPADTAAQAIVSFHQEPSLSYNDKKYIWSNDKTYGKYFNENLKAGHVIFCFSLLKSLEDYKNQLKMKKEDNRTVQENAVLLTLRKRGSVYILVSAIGHCMEIILDKVIKNNFLISFSKIENLAELIDTWKPIISSTVPFINQLNNSLENALKNSKIIETDISNFTSMVSATSTANRTIFNAFAEKVATD